MAIALVAQGTISLGTTSASPAFGAATTAGNLLVARLGSIGGSTVGTPTGWTVGSDSGQGCALFYKANCGASETAPTFSNGTGTWCAADLLEFSGVAATSPIDRAGGNSAVWNNGTNITLADSTASDVAVWVGNWVNSKSATYTSVTDSWTPAGGTVVAASNSGATKNVNLFHGSAYLLNGNGGSAIDVNSASATPSTGVQSSASCVLVTFKPASTVVTPNRPIVAGQAVNRSARY